MDLKKLSKRILIIGTLVIWAVKFGIRPFFYFDEPLEVFLGIAPNFFGSFLIPFGAFLLFNDRYFLVARLFHVRSNTDLRSVCWIGFTLLLINEYLQMIPVFGRTFDYLDILFSAVGLSISYFVFGKLYSRSVLSYNSSEVL